MRSAPGVRPYPVALPARACRVDGDELPSRSWRGSWASSSSSSSRTTPRRRSNPCSKRIPSSVFVDYDCHNVLIVDDASDDRTFAIGREYLRSHPTLPMTVLRNQYNQGYGGNQKIGYTLRDRRRFRLRLRWSTGTDNMPRRSCLACSSCRRGEADAVFASRYDGPIRAGAEGRNALYKYVGNKVLTTVQNAMLGTRLLGVPQRLPDLLGEGARPGPVPPQTRTTSTSTPRSPSSCLNAGARRGSCPSPRTTATRSVM